MIVENAAHGGKEDPILIAFDDFIKRTSDFLMANLRSDYFPAHPDGSAEIVLAYDQEKRFSEFRSNMYGHQF